MMKAEDQNFIAQLLLPLFNRMGLNGPAAMPQAQPQAKPKTPILSDSALKAMGYSDADIRAVRQWEKSDRR